MTTSQRQLASTWFGVACSLAAAGAVPAQGVPAAAEPSASKIDAPATASRDSAPASSARDASQDGVRWFLPSEPFAPLIADPLESQIRGSIVGAELDLTGLEGADPETVELLENRNAQSEVALAYRQNVVQFQAESSSRPAIAIAFEVGIFSRFMLETPQRDLVSADFRVGLPFEITYSGWEGRFEILHMSSHFGDDLFDRLGLPNSQVTFDGFQLIAARRLIPAVRLYVGGDFNFHTNPGVEDVAVKWGIEWDGSEVAERGSVWPLVAADFRLTDETERVAGTALAGVTFRISSVRLQLALRGHFGPSTIGKFRNFDENFIGLGLRIFP